MLVLRDKLRRNRQMEFQTSRAATRIRPRFELCDEARGAYITVLRNTVRRYGKNIRALGELAGIEVTLNRRIWKTTTPSWRRPG